VAEQFAGIVLLQFDHAWIENDAVLAVAQHLGLRQTVAGLELTTNVEIQVDINPAFFQFGDDSVEPVQLRLVEVLRIRRVPGKQCIAPRRVEPMETDQVEAKLGQPVREAWGDVHRRQAAFAREIDAPEPDALAVLETEVPVPHHQRAMLAGGRIEQETGVCDRAGRRLPRQVKGHPRLFTGRAGYGKDEYGK